MNQPTLGDKHEIENILELYKPLGTVQPKHAWWPIRLSSCSSSAVLYFVVISYNAICHRWFDPQIREQMSGPEIS